MNFFSVILILFHNFFCAVDHISINEVLLLENDYVTVENERVSTEEGFFSSALIEMDCDKKKHSLKCSYSTIYLNFKRKKKFAVMSLGMTKDILFAASPQNEQNMFLKFRLSFYKDDFLTKLHSEPYEKKFFYYYENYKKIIKDAGDIIKLESNSFDCYLYHVKEIVQELFNRKFIIFNAFKRDFKEQTPKFTLQYFETLTSCFENFKKFVIYLNCLKLDSEEPIEKPGERLHENNECSEEQGSSSDSDSFAILGNGSFKSDSSSIEEESSTKSSLDLKMEDKTNLISKDILDVGVDNVLKISYLKVILQEKFDKDFKDKKDVDERIKRLFDEISYMFNLFSYEIILQLSLNEIILPVKGIFTLEFYLDKFYHLIKNEIETMNKDYFELGCEGVSYSDIAFRFKRKFKRKLIEMQKSIINDVWESANVREYFSVLIGREIKNAEDMMFVNKIVCDYRNMMFCESISKRDVENFADPYFIYPKLIDNLECRLIKGIEIRFNHPIKYKKYQVYDSADTKLFTSTTAGHLIKLKNCDKLVLPFENLREMKVHKIKAYSGDKAIEKFFPVSKYLDTC